MKKFAALLLAAVMTTSLAACGSGDNDSDRESESRSGGLSSILGGSDSEDNNSSSEGSDSSEGNDSSSGADESSSGSLSDFMSSGDYVHPVDGFAEGYLGDILSTEWFDFKVNDVYDYGSEYNGHEAYDGYRLLAVDITILNTYGSGSTPMFDTDFMIVWGDGDYDYDFPVDAAETLGNEFLPSEYYMSAGDMKTGLLLFEVPETCTDFGLFFVEYYADDTEGDTFAVWFQTEASSDDYQLGFLGDTMSTQWFDFTLDSATLYSDYAGNTPTNGYQFLVLEMSLKNTFPDDVPMFDTDFQVEWDDDAPSAYALPVAITVDGEELLDAQVDSYGDEYKYYNLPMGADLSLVMVYEVPVDYSDFLVLFEELDEENIVGNLFAVYFVPEQQ